MLFELIACTNDNLREARGLARELPDVHELLDRAQAILLIAEAITAPTAAIEYGRHWSDRPQIYTEV